MLVIIFRTRNIFNCENYFSSKKKVLYVKMKFNVLSQNVRSLITKLNTTCDRGLMRGTIPECVR
jgi:hypothetical protein